MARLLEDVDGKRESNPTLGQGARGLDLDIICSVVDAFLDEPRVAAGHSDPEGTSITGKARLRLVVAALIYLVEIDDVIPDSQPNGLTDDVVLLRWASRMSRAELPAS